MMIKIIFILYLVITILNLKYIKRDRLPKRTTLIVVLSANRDDITLSRLKTAVRLRTTYPHATIAICGKEKADLMKGFLKANGVVNILVQNRSTNTHEDAFYLKNLLTEKEKSSFILITSSAHQRRAYNTFRRVFKSTIWNHPTNDILSFYSPLLPSGWIFNTINLIKDKQYNNQLLATLFLSMSYSIQHTRPN